MRFDTVHEYYFANSTCIHYCEDHDTLVIANHGEGTDRLMIEGIGKDAMNRLRNDLNKAHLEATTNVTNQNTPTGATATEGSN